MSRQVLRFVLGLGYVVLVTCLLLIQTGTANGTGNREIAMLEILLLGIPLAVVLILYIRVSEKIREQQEKESSEKENSVTPISYEENYEYFIRVTEPYSLSERESEVAWLLYRGYTNRQIGEELFIAETTVKKHVTHIYEKMQVTGRKEFRETLFFK